MALIVVGFIFALTEGDVDMALIQNIDANDSHFDTAWTIEVLLGVGMAACIFLSSPFVAKLFDEPRVAPVMQLLALSPLIGGFENIGVVAFQKELAFSRDFQYEIYQKILSFFVVVSLAVVLRSYWALAIGVVFASASGVLLSYVMHPYRPVSDSRNSARSGGFRGGIC